MLLMRDTSYVSKCGVVEVIVVSIDADLTAPPVGCELARKLNLQAELESLSEPTCCLTTRRRIPQLPGISLIKRNTTSPDKCCSTLGQPRLGLLERVQATGSMLAYLTGSHESERLTHEYSRSQEDKIMESNCWSARTESRLPNPSPGYDSPRHQRGELALFTKNDPGQGIGIFRFALACFLIEASLPIPLPHRCFSSYF